MYELWTSIDYLRLYLQQRIFTYVNNNEIMKIQNCSVISVHTTVTQIHQQRRNKKLIIKQNATIWHWETKINGGFSKYFLLKLFYLIVSEFNGKKIAKFLERALVDCVSINQSLRQIYLLF